MPRRRNSLPVLAFITSLMIHAMLLIALPLAIDAATPPPEPAGPQPEEQVMVMPVELELGVDAPTPPSETWIGFEEPEPQLAEQAENEQAAFTDQQVAAAPPESTASPEMEPPAQEPQEPVEAVASEMIAPEPVEPATEESIAPEELTGETPLGDDGSSNPDPRAAIQPPDVEALADAVKEVVEQIQKAIEEAMEAIQPPQPTITQTPSQNPSPQPSPAQPEQPPQPQVAPEPTDAPEDIGTPADKESPPTSIIDVPRDQWELGKPLARHGLLLKPRRPEFTLLTMMTASPGNPLCLMKFNRQGIPVVAALMRSSGDQRVDDAVLASLYRWRAEGAELTRLAEGKTLDVQIRLVLNRRALKSESEEPPQTAKAE